MESSPVFREVKLLIQSPQDVEFAWEIIQGKATVSQIADIKGQDQYTFYGDGDVVILTYDYDSDALLNETDAAKVVKNLGNEFVQDTLIPSLVDSKASIELVLKYCNLSTEAIICLCEAIRENRSIVGFSIQNNPGNCEIGEIALKYACIRTRAPIRWFQGKALTDSLVEARELFASGKLGGDDQHQLLGEEEDDDDDLTTIVVQEEIISIRSQSPPQVIAAELPPVTPRGRSGISSLILESEPSSSTRQRASKQPRRVRWNDRELWRLEMKKLLRTIHKVIDEKELDHLVSNLELYDLQMRIDYLLFGEDGLDPALTAGFILPSPVHQHHQNKADASWSEH